MSDTDTIQPDLSLPELFRRYPETRAVFNRYGLRGCGGEHGPAESLAFFASAHGVQLDALIEQIRQVINNPFARDRARKQLADDAQPHLADMIYRPFFLAGMAVVLTVGAAWGVLLLWKIAFSGSFTGVSVNEVNAHGHAQIMGWVGLFMMGFAYQAFPRMWHVDLPAPRLALATWGAMLVGIAARSGSMMFEAFAWAGPVHRIGVLIEVAAVFIFILQLLTAFRRSDQPIKPYIGFAFAALGFFLIQTLFGGWHIDRLMHATGHDALLSQIATYQAPLRDLQIHGLAMMMILAVGIRLFPALFGFAEISDRRGWLAFALLLSAIVFEVLLFLTYRLSGNRAFAAAMLLPWVLLPLGVGLVIAPWRLWRPFTGDAASERSGKFIRIAFLWLFVSFTMLLLLPVYQVVSNIPFSHAYYGAIRHAITVGFISMMIVGMAAKVVPTLRGIESDRLPSLWLPFTLINLGCLMRVGFQVGTDWDAVFFKLIGISGILEWTGLAIWASHLVAVMLGRGRYRQTDAATWGPAPQQIEPDHRVAAVLHWHPELEPVFVEHGFDLIRNSVLRRTIARQVSLAQVCRMKRVDLDGFLAALNEQRSQAEHDPPTAGRTCGDLPASEHAAGVTIEGQPMGPTSLNATVKA